LYVPSVADRKAIQRLAREIDGPLNVLGARGGSNDQPLSVGELEALGVRRVSIGGSLALAMLGLVRRAGVELLNRGTFGYARAAMSNVEATEIFRRVLQERGPNLKEVTEA
jgi:2-methylisocitrate lyase-like PEP mutase family enzyme